MCIGRLMQLWTKASTGTRVRTTSTSTSSSPRALSIPSIPKVSRDLAALKSGLTVLNMEARKFRWMHSAKEVRRLLKYVSSMQPYLLSDLRDEIPSLRPLRPAWNDDEVRKGDPESERVVGQTFLRITHGLLRRSCETIGTAYTLYSDIGWGHEMQADNDRLRRTEGDIYRGTSKFRCCTRPS